MPGVATTKKTFAREAADAKQQIERDAPIVIFLGPQHQRVVGAVQL